MKIALLGYGKMGHMIEQAAIDRNHEIVLRVRSENRAALTKRELQKADCVIEFSRPASAVENILLCLDAAVPVVVGTTGWHEQVNEVKQKCEEKNGSLIYGSNFSLGVNMLFGLNRLLAGWMKNIMEYRPSINEQHHVHKLDKPSGTAITLAEDIIGGTGRFKAWNVLEMGAGETADKNILPIYYLRQDEIPGTHEVIWTSSIDEIGIRHSAFNRQGFALGAVLAAEFIQGKRGFFTVSQMFKKLFDPNADS